jgi:DNA repair protein RecO (recombination protein O)
MPSADRSFRTPAVIVKRRDFAEADRMLTILTPNHGKLDVIAKGARKLTSHKTGHVELFTRSDMVIHRASEIGVVAQAEMIEPYQELREDLRRGAFANYAAELLDRFTATGEDDTRDLFNLFDTTLKRLCTDPDPQLALRYYEMHVLDLVGFRPELNECVIGHEPIQPEDQFFSVFEGGIVCPRHATQSSSSMPISVNALKLLRHIQRSRYDQMRDLQVPSSVHEDADRIMITYITFLLERRLQSIDFIRRLRFN